MIERALPSDPERERAVDVLVGQMVATRALVSALQAQEAVLLSAAMEIVLCGAEGDDVRGSDLPVRSLAAEVGAALRVSDRSVQRQLTDAVALTERFPATFAALAAGRISRAHANVIMDAGCHLADPELRAAYEASVLPYAESESASRLRPVARLRAERIAPSSLQERHDRARARRAVRIVDLEDGMSDLIATLPAVLAHGAFDRLTQLARDVREAEAAGVDSGDDGANEGGDGAGHRCDGFDGDGQGADGCGGDGQGADEVERGQSAIGDDGVGSVRGAARRSTDELRADIFADLLLAGAPA
ncbi:MAG: DUF222 domain-containing protein, partial [Microbacterium sp.]|nr:DUF222 domain-containing protein [Microbacterium sp.]